MLKDIENGNIDWRLIELHLDQMIEEADSDFLFLEDLSAMTNKNHMRLLNDYSYEVSSLTNVILIGLLEERYEVCEKAKIVINNEIENLEILIKEYFPEDLKEEANEELHLIKTEYKEIMETFLNRI